MNRMNRHFKCRSKLVAIAALIGVSMTAHAATLPPPPVSPAPVTDYEYDAKGNPTKVIKAKGVNGFNFATTNTYDGLDRVKDSTDARNGVTKLGYDGIDQLKQVTDPRNLVTSYQRNGLGDLNQLSSPDTGTANSTFDAGGNLLTRTDSRGVLGTFTYDNLDRLKTAVYSKSGQTSVSYGWTYDQSGGDFGYGVGRLTTATFPGGSTKYGYDGQGRVITVIQTVSTVVSTTRYAYDGAGNVTSITYPSGRVLTISYDRGLPVGLSLAKDGTSTAKPLISQIQWEPFGAARGWLFHMNGGTKAYERVFDQYGRLVRYPLDTITRDISYDAADRIVSYSHLETASATATAAAQAMNQSFGYDELGRLTGITTPSASWSIGYDANGNRTGVTLNGAASTYTTEATSNRLSSISNPARAFGYDAAGNTLSDTGIAYTATYGLDNRLATLTRAGVTSSFNYDAGGQRVRKVVGSSRPHYVYDQNGQLLGEYNSVGGALQEFVWLGNTLVAVLTNSTTTEPRVYYAYSDHLNAPRVIVNSAGDARWKWLSEPFGSTAAESVPNSLETLVVNLRLPGQYFDKESGLHYNYFRDYDATSGRYVQSDPIGLGGGINTFSYVANRPLRSIDPNGLNPVAGGEAGFIAGSIFCGPACGFVGAVGGAGLGAWIGWEFAGPAVSRLTRQGPVLLPPPASAAGAPMCSPSWNDGNSYVQPPADAKDPNGAKAPGKPGEAEGFKDPKGGEDWVRSPRGYGWRDSKGNVWVPTGPGDLAHGGPHWDVQLPGGGYVNVYPGGARR